MIEHEILKIGACEAVLSRWSGPGRGECHAVLTSSGRGSLQQQVLAVKSAIATLSESHEKGSRGVVAVMTRFYVSDLHNIERDSLAGGVVGQTPLDGSKVAALVIYMECDGPYNLSEYDTVILRGAYTDVWSIADSRSGVDSRTGAGDFFRHVISTLSQRGGNLKDNCVRTWFFVHDIDNAYPGLVDSRNEVFARENLTAGNHFIASTGIGGVLDCALHSESLSVLGLKEGQMGHLSAPGRMNKTSDYGVAFERGTFVDYGDRRVIYVSGTASIGAEGEILYPGDVMAQAERMAGNVEALLAEGAAGKGDLMHIVVYVRDWTDGESVIKFMERRFPGVPCVAVQGPVCRPGWLVEMECMAMTEQCEKCYASY